AGQRTFQGAYWRTALAAFSMGLLIQKVFTAEFYHISITFFLFGISMLSIAHWRTKHAYNVFCQKIPFQTSGNFVWLSFSVTFVTYIIFLILLLNL
ncbi:hypothetical protein K501DRAFT_149187, partial [Backusella circina FSU 941]